MLRFLASRLGTAVIVLFALTLIVFVLSRVIPADPAVVYAGPKAPPEELARIREKLGFDQPLILQYFDYLGGLVTGDWGDSLATKRPVLDELATRLPATLELLFAAMLIAVVFGIVLGVVAAKRPGKALDGTDPLSRDRRCLDAGVLARTSPAGALRRAAEAAARDRPVQYRGRSTSRRSRRSPDSRSSTASSPATGSPISDGLAHLVLPAITLAAYPLGLIARMTRASVLEVLGQDYVFTANAYGLRDVMIRWKLALKNALSPTMTIIGLAAAYTLTGTFFVEVVFNWPGIGQFAAGAMLAVDYPAIMAITLLGAAGYLIANLVVDIVQARLDPRVTLS